MQHRVKYYLFAFVLGFLLTGPVQILAQDQEVLEEDAKESAVLEQEQTVDLVSWEETNLNKAELTEEIDTDTELLEDAVVQESTAGEYALSKESITPTITYYAHVENIGDQDMKSNGEMAGTEGKSLRMEAVTIYLDSGSYDGDIQYAAHVENIGWQDPVSSGQMTGTRGQALRMEAIKIWLTGSLADDYDIYYQAHVQDFGWLGWASNGQCSGSAGYSKRMEALTIKLIQKNGGIIPTYPEEPFVANGINYEAHVSNVGWQPYVHEGQTAGTTGQSNSVESFRIRLDNQQYDGSIQYAVNILGEGWQSEKRDDDLAGTVGLSKPIQALKIYLTGEIANHYSVFYRVHSSNIGWQGWTSDGNPAGTSNYGQKIEAFEVKLLDRYQTKPSVSADAYLVNMFSYNAHVSNIGWQNLGTDGSLAGTTGRGLPVEAVHIYLENTGYTGDILYRTYIQNSGWESTWKKNGAISGTTGESKPIEAIQIKLEGEIANYYNIFYRTHIANYGWLAWTSDGLVSGTEGLASPIEALEITLSKTKTDTTNTISSIQSNIGYIDNTKAVGWQKINGYDYYFYDDGTLAKDTVLSDAAVDSLGRKIEGITVINGTIVHKKHLKPAYYNQTDNRWGQIYYGNWNLASSGCVPTSLAMVLEGITGRTTTPEEVANYLYYHAENEPGKSWDFNNPANGEGGGSGYSVRYAADYWGVMAEGVSSYEDFIAKLTNGNLFVLMMGNGNFAGVGYTHAVVGFGYDEQSNALNVYDPYYSSKNGLYNAGYIWNQRSTSAFDNKDGFAFHALY